MDYRAHLRFVGINAIPVYGSSAKSQKQFFTTVRELVGEGKFHFADMDMSPHDDDPFDTSQPDTIILLQVNYPGNHAYAQSKHGKLAILQALDDAQDNPTIKIERHDWEYTDTNAKRRYVEMEFTIDNNGNNK